MESNHNEIVTNISNEQAAITTSCQTNKTNGFAIAGFVLSFFLVILGLIFSIVGLKKSKTLGNGKGLSIAGIVISSVFMLITILVIIFVIPTFIYSFNNDKIDTFESNARLVIASINNQNIYYDIINEEFPKSGNCPINNYENLGLFKTCTYSIDSDANVMIDIVGTGIYEGYMICNATKNNINITKGSSCN